MRKKLVQKKIDLRNQRGFTFHFGPFSIGLDRTPSTNKSAGTWQEP
jgi:hypothetical protein